MMTAMAKGGATYHSLLKKLPIFIRKQTRAGNVTSSCRERKCLFVFFVGGAVSLLLDLELQRLPSGCTVSR